MGRQRVFKFKHFDVLNDKTAMKVGTDGVLLGAWCDVAGARRVLDVGTGCGVIALMVAQRNSEATILGIDIDAAGVQEAAYNFAHSPWSDRLEARLEDFNRYTAGEPLDLIVSNPPFFTNGVMPPEQARMNARHTSTLNYATLISKSRQLLSPAGILSMITPCDAHQEIVEQCAFNSLNIKRLTSVIAVDGAKPKRELWEITPARCDMAVGEIVIEKSPLQYTQEYRDLCHDFYLKF